MKRRDMFLFFTATSLFWFALYTYPVLLAGYAKNVLGATPVMAGLIVGSYGLVQLLLRIPIGFASDKLRRRKPFLTLGSALGALAALVLFRAGTPEVARIGRSIAGASAAAWVCYSVLYASYGAQTQSTQRMGALSSCMYGAQLIGTLIGSEVAQRAGVRSAFALAIAAGVIGTVCTLFVRDVRPTTEPPTTSALLSSFKSRSLWVASILSILMQLIIYATLYGFSPTWAQEMLHAGTSLLGLLSTMHLLPNVLVSYLAARYVVPRIGKAAVCALGFLCMAASCLFMPMTTAFWQMLCLQSLCGIGLGCIAPILLALCIRDIPAERRGIGMGIYQSLYSIGMFAGPTLAGVLVQACTQEAGGGAGFGYQCNFWVMGGVGLIAALLSLALMREKQAA